MYFQINNTPELVKKQRKKQSDENNQVIPVLKLGPFSRPPVITFDNILIGQISSNCLQLHNPTTNILQISVSKFPPEELNLKLSWTEMCIGPDETCPLEILWNPTKVVAQSVNIQFVDHKKGRFDATIICKSKTNKPTNSKGAIKKTTQYKLSTTKKSPKRLSPRKNSFFINTKKKENILKVENDLILNVSTEIKKQTSVFTTRKVNIELPHNISHENDAELAKAMRRETYCVSKIKPVPVSPKPRNAPLNLLSAIDDLKFTPLKTFDQPLNDSSDKENTYVKTPVYLKLNGKDANVSDLIDQLDFTPLKCERRLPNMVKPKQVFSVNAEITVDPNFIPKNVLQERRISNVQYYKPEKRNIISVTNTIIDIEGERETNKLVNDKKDKAADVFDYLNENNCRISFENQQSISFTPNNKSFDSILVFDPKRCSTEKKNIDEKSSNMGETFNVTYDRLSSDTYVKVGDSPIVPIDPERDHLQSSPYSITGNSPIFLEPLPPTHRSTFSKKLPFSDNTSYFNERTEMRNANKEKNFSSSIQGIINADLWQKGNNIRPKSPTSLSVIAEESISANKDASLSFVGKGHFETFILNKTFEKPAPTHKLVENQSWKKSSVKCDPILKYDCKINVLENVASENFEYINIKSIATTVDPFLATTCLYDEKAYEEMENEFKMWLNYLLTPPAEFDTENEDKKMDFGMAWIENRNKNVPLAPTKEQVSSKYHTSHRLESLRKVAKSFVSKPEITQVFLKVANQIERKILAIRVDKNIHLDIGLQKIILHLLKCYNPLWLRIALETIYGQNINLTSNDDFFKLSEFITENLFKDSYIASKHASVAVPNIFLPSFAENIKRFTLKKFLYLVYFLDRAKESKIIPHDPCLFRRNAQYKESREILIQFAKEVLAGVGDITKHLKPTGYIVTHKQSYLNEFKYAVHNLAVDLKDGVRLTRLMEIILMQNNLHTSLRTPAISRLQKVHNVKIALTALESAGFKIVGDITPKDIADGHREKTLSLLWQLINKFRAPLFEKAALVLQKWWRKKLLKITLEKRIEYRKLIVFHNAATKIQSKWKQILCRRNYLNTLKAKTAACICIQKTWRMYRIRSKFSKKSQSAIIIQRWYRRLKAIEMAKMIMQRDRESKAAAIIQCWFRKKKSQQIGKTCIERQEYLLLRKSANCIQTAFKAHLEMKKARNVYIVIRESTIKIQQYYRAVVATRKLRNEYLELKNSTIILQRRFRAYREMQHCKQQYNQMKEASVLIQNYYKSYKLMKQQREYYITLKKATLVLQQHYKAKILMKEERNKYIELKNSTIILQRRFRAYKEKQHCKTEYNRLKAATILIQSYYRMIQQREYYTNLKKATLVLQQHYKAQILMKKERNNYLELKNSASTLQKYYRARLIMMKTRNAFKKQKMSATVIQRSFRLYLEKKRRINAAMKIQKFYRNQKLCMKVKENYVQTRSAAIVIQQKYRALCAMRKDRKEYFKLKKSALIIQHRFRAQIAMKKESKTFNEKKCSAIKIQRFYRNFKQMERKTKAAKCIQTYYRNYLISRKTHSEYVRMKQAIVVIQQRFRGFILMKTLRKQYLLKLKSISIIQHFYRSYKLMKLEHENYIKMKQSAIAIQRCFRKYSQKKKENNAAKVIQKYFRNYLLNRKIRNDFVQLKNAAVFIQQMYRFKIHITKKRFEERHHAASVIQKYYKGYVTMKAERYSYLKIKKACSTIQQKYRANKLCKESRENYLQLRNAATIIQQRYRAQKLMKANRQSYVALLNAAILIQRKYRAKKLMTSCVDYYETLKCATIQIQTWYRSVKLLRKIRAVVTRQRELNQIALEERSATLIQAMWKSYLAQNYFYTARFATIMIQRWYKSILAMREQRIEYIKMRQAAVKIQTSWRRYKIRKEYLKYRECVVYCQRKYRAQIEMKTELLKYTMIRNAAVRIQAIARGWLMRRKVKEILINYKEHQYLKRRIQSATIIQRCWRGYNVRKKQAENSKAAELRQRWRNGALNSNQLTLAERSEDAMSVLRHFNDISAIIRAFKTLDYVTNVYPMMYDSEDIVKPIISRLVLYIDSSNRSVPTLETIQLAVSVLVNLAKYKPTSKYIYNDENMDIFLKLMLRWCDKDSLLSRLFCTLIWILAKYEHIYEEIHEKLQQPKCYKMLCQIRSLLIRRKRMDSRKRTSLNINQTPVKSTDVRRSITPVKMGRPLAKPESPSLDPNYGVIHTKKPRIFTDDIHAIESVFFKYKLELNIVTDACEHR